MNSRLDIDALSAALAKIDLPVVELCDSKGYARVYQRSEEPHFVTGDLLAETYGDGDKLIAQVLNAAPVMIAEITALRALENIDAPAFGNLHRVQHGGECAVKPKLGESLVQWAADEIAALRAQLCHHQERNA